MFAPSRLVVAAIHHDMNKIFLPHVIAMFFFIVPIMFRMRSMLAHYPVSDAPTPRLRDNQCVL